MSNPENRNDGHADPWDRLCALAVTDALAGQCVQLYMHQKSDKDHIDALLHCVATMVEQIADSQRKELRHLKNAPNAVVQCSACEQLFVTQEAFEKHGNHCPA